MREHAKSDIISFCSKRSGKDVKSQINKTIETISNEYNSHLRINKKEGETIRLTGVSREAQGNAFAVDISTRTYDGYTLIDIAALGGDLSEKNVRSGEDVRLHLDMRTSGEIRDKIFLGITEERRTRIKERLRYIKDVKRREIFKKMMAARENGKPVGENEEYEAARAGMEKNENEIAELENELNDYKPEKISINPESVFSYNLRYGDYTALELAQKTGISAERIRKIGEGAEPLLSEFLSLSVAFDVDLETMVMQEWFRHEFATLYRYPEKTFEDSVNEGNILKTVFLASAAFIKTDDDIFYRTSGKGFEKIKKKPDKELLDRARLFLLKNNLPAIAAGISAKKNFLELGSFLNEGVSTEAIGKYLFNGGSGAPFSYFIPFFNALNSDEEKDIILAMALHNLKACAKKEKHNTCTDAKRERYVNYAATDKNGVLVLSKPWIYRDFTQLQTDSKVKEEIIKMQEEVTGE